MSIALETDALVSDLNLLKEREDMVKELRILSIKDLSLSLPKQSDVAELTNIYHQYMPLDDNTFTLNDRMIFCQSLINNAVFPVEQLLLKKYESKSIEDIAYVKNQYSSEALEKFKNHVSIKKERIFNSFNEMCDDIESGVYDDCIIPLENTSNGKLINFYSIIDRLDMKIAITCDVEAKSGDQITRYALVRRNVSVPNNPDCNYLEFSFTVSEHFGIKNMLDISYLIGLELYRIDSIPQQYNESSFVYYPVLQGSTENILLFLFFLELNLIPYNLIGLYDRI